MLIIIVAFLGISELSHRDIERKILKQDQLKINLNLPNGALSPNEKNLMVLG